MYTSDDAQQLVDLQDENGPEAWRQLSRRYDPIGESYVFDQMAALMDLPRGKQLTELPTTLTRWDRSLQNLSERTAGQAVPPSGSSSSCLR